MKTNYTLLFLLAASLLGQPILAKEKKDEKQKTEKVEKKEKQEKQKKSRKDKKGKTEEAPKDSVKVEKPQVDRPGLFHVTKMKNDWFFQIPDSLIGRDFLTTVRFTSTPANSGKFGGEQLNEQMVYFQTAPDDQMLLRSKLLINVADSTQEIHKAITISNENPIIGSFKIEEHKDGVYKIKVNGFFQSDNPALGLPQSAKTQFALQGLIGEMSFIEDIKSFPLNTEVRLTKTYASNGSVVIAARQTGKVTFGLNISFILLPKTPMQPRYYDPRVGYFTESYTAYDDQQQHVQPKSLIARYRLEPKPEDVEKMRRGELVEPIKPIVYYIDPATPKQWRKYLIMGVEDWKVAFEQAGFKNAIQAREWPENDSTMSMEDARFCCIRYLASPIENAYGPHVSDPRSGEIMESHICWYHNVMRLVHDWYMIQAASVDEAAQRMSFDEELMGQLIRFVSSHEVGHSLGLRHNFGSSSLVPVDSLRSKAFVEKYGHTPSIMDYARFNYVAQPEDGISRDGLFPRINDYDKWAIEWGYKPLFAANEDEDHLLMEPFVVEAQKNPRLWWGDGESPEGRLDPRRQTEDLGDDATKASAYGIKNLQREIVHLTEWTSDDKKDIYGNDLRSMYDEFVTQFRRYCGHVARYIGGTLITWKPKEQSGDIYQPTPLDRQKAALKFAEEYMFTEPVWLRDLPYARRIQTDPQLLTTRLAPSLMSMVIDRLDYVNELYPAQAFLDDLVKLVFSEADSHKKVSLYRQALQGNMVDNLLTAYGNNNATIQPAVLRTLQTLEKKTKAASASAPDTDSRAHWASLYDRIGRRLSWK